MDSELKEKLESIIDKHNFVSADGAVKSHRSFVLGGLEDAYNLALQESAEKIEAQQQLLESMGETNTQLAKRLGKIEILIIDADEPAKTLTDIWNIINPKVL